MLATDTEANLGGPESAWPSPPRDRAALVRKDFGMSRRSYAEDGREGSGCAGRNARRRDARPTSQHRARRQATAHHQLLCGPQVLHLPRAPYGAVSRKTTPAPPYSRSSGTCTAGAGKVLPHAAGGAKTCSRDARQIALHRTGCRAEAGTTMLKHLLTTAVLKQCPGAGRNIDECAGRCLANT